MITWTLVLFLKGYPLDPIVLAGFKTSAECMAPHSAVMDVKAAGLDVPLPMAMRNRVCLPTAANATRDDIMRMAMDEAASEEQNLEFMTQQGMDPYQ